MSDAFEARVEQEPASADGGAADQSSTEPISILSTLRNCWQRPAWTAERAQHIRLPHAWLVHAMAMLCIFVSPTLLEAGLSQNPPGELKRRVEVILHWIVEAPEQAFVAFGGSALVFEILFLLFALALMTWGARVEPVRRSYRVTLQRVWIQTVHLAIAILSVVVVSVVIDQVFRRPFFLAFSWLEVLSFFMSGIAIAWAYWGFIKAVGAPRDAPQIPVSPTCEGCGYNLTHTSSDERCTECGRPVSESLGEHVRPGLQERAAALLPAAFLKPQRLGERVRLYERTQNMSPAFWMAFGLTWLVSYASSLVLAWVLGGIDFETVGAMLLPATLVTCLVTTCGLLVPSVLGCWFMWREGRNLMPAGAQLAAVWGGYRVIIVAVAWLSVAAMNGPAETLLQDLGHMLKLNPLYVGLLVWIVLMLALAGVYIATMYRAMYAARYANR